MSGFGVGVGDPQALLQQRAGGGVLQRPLLIRVALGKTRMRGQSGFVKAAHNEALLANVAGHVADGINAIYRGREGGAVNVDLFACHGQAPIADGAQFGTQAQPYDQLVKWEGDVCPICPICPICAGEGDAV